MKKKILLFGIIAISFVLLGCNQVVNTYSAESFQSETSAPEMIVFENTIGNIEWEYISIGVYHGKLTGGFPLEKTFLMINNGTSYAMEYDLRWINADIVELRTFANPGNGSDVIPINGASSVFFEIRVYD